MLRLPVMKTFASAVVVLLCACAGPEEHRKPSAESALNVESVAAPRERAGSVLEADSPLDVGEKPAPAQPHHHHEAGVTEMVEDPVCHMKINPAKAGGGSLTVDGVKSYFCSSSCRSKFLTAHPEAK